MACDTGAIYYEFRKSCTVVSDFEQNFMQFVDSKKRKNALKYNNEDKRLKI